MKKVQMPESAVRRLESYRQKGDLLQGVKLPGGGILRIEKTLYRSNFRRIFRTISRITESLKVCKGLAETEKEGQVILVTKDIVLRLKAQILGIRAEDFERNVFQKMMHNIQGARKYIFRRKRSKNLKRKVFPLQMPTRAMRKETGVH